MLTFELKSSIVPLHTLSKRSRFVSKIVSPCVVLTALMSSSQLVLANDSEGETVVPPMTVFGIKKADDTYTQISEIEWHQSNDKSISKESDGSYTVKSTTNSYSLKKLMISLGRPMVNVDLRYAKRSSSMTAEGNLTFKKLVEALGYLDEGARIHLTPIVDGSSSAARVLMQRRLEELLRSIQLELDVNLVVKPHKVRNQNAEKPSKINSGTSDLWRIKIQQQRSQ